MTSADIVFQIRKKNELFFFKGLFVQCLQWMPGQFQCDNFLRPVFSLSGYALAQRALAIFSIWGLPKYTVYILAFSRKLNKITFFKTMGHELPFDIQFAFISKVTSTDQLT